MQKERRVFTQRSLRLASDFYADYSDLLPFNKATADVPEIKPVLE